MRDHPCRFPQLPKIISDEIVLQVFLIKFSRSRASLVVTNKPSFNKQHHERMLDGESD
jgi:hypothetical protein